LLFGVMECYKRTERALRVLCLQNILGAALYCNNISAEGPTVFRAYTIDMVDIGSLFLHCLVDITGNCQ
jgi:hypothetical protein